MPSEEHNTPTPAHTLRSQFMRYFGVALIGYIVDFGGMIILRELAGINYLTAAVLSFVAGLIVVYLLSNYFVFSNSKIQSRSVEFGLFALIGLVGLGILSILMWIFVSIFGINYIIAKIISTVFVYLWNFFARRSLYHN